MGRFGDGALAIEMKHRLGGTRAKLGQAPPPGIAAPSLPMAQVSLTHEIDIGMVAIGGPVMLKVVEKRWPVVRQTVALKIRAGGVIEDTESALSFFWMLDRATWPLIEKTVARKPTK